jgi:hypothetical protein
MANVRCSVVCVMCVLCVLCGLGGLGSTAIGLAASSKQYGVVGFAAMDHVPLYICNGL